MDFFFLRRLYADNLLGGVARKPRDCFIQAEARSFEGHRKEASVRIVQAMLPLSVKGCKSTQAHIVGLSCLQDFEMALSCLKLNISLKGNHAFFL